MSQKLEEEFKESEERRRKMEESVSQRQEGLPTEGKRQLQLMEEFLRLNAGVLEANAFKRLCNIVDLTKLSMDLTGKLEEFNIDITGQSGVLDKVVVALNGAQRELSALTKKLSVEFEERGKQRELERETLVKLNSYLENWL